MVCVKGRKDERELCHLRLVKNRHWFVDHTMNTTDVNNEQTDI